MVGSVKRPVQPGVQGRECLPGQRVDARESRFDIGVAG